MVNSIYKVTINGDHFIRRRMRTMSRVPHDVFLLGIIGSGVYNTKEALVNKNIPELESNLKYLLDSGFIVEINSN